MYVLPGVILKCNCSQTSDLESLAVLLELWWWVGRHLYVTSFIILKQVHDCDRSQRCFSELCYKCLMYVCFISPPIQKSIQLQIALQH